MINGQKGWRRLALTAGATGWHSFHLAHLLAGLVADTRPEIGPLLGLCRQARA